MNKWEYCVLGPIKGLDSGGLMGYYPSVLFFGLDGISRNVSLTLPLRGKISGNEQVNIAKAIAQLGAEGWEMVGSGVVPFGSEPHPHHVLYFKRLIE